MKFKFGDKVQVTEEFYSNHIGVVKYLDEAGYVVQFRDGDTVNEAYVQESEMKRASDIYTDSQLPESDNELLVNDDANKLLRET